uniref:Ubiquitin-like domain-containing protein n=1 Tax=Araucaria cunninghamii TaxID=56994 RepID=A0A0D6QX22_ARACU
MGGGEGMGGEGDKGLAETSGVENVGENAKGTIHIRCSNGSKFSVEAELVATVAAFKVLLAEKCEIPAEQQRLIYKGRILKDENTLQSYGLQSDHTVHLVRGSPPVASTNAAAAGNAATTTNNTAAQPVQGVPSTNNGGLGGAGLGGLLFPGLGGNGPSGNGMTGLFGTGLPEFQQVQQQLTQNPNMIREMMNMPAIQNLMNNPDLMRNLIMSNPQMREIIDRNPDLAHILNDPATLRQTLDAARNPELMREMMRNTDRAMSNIESSPEGFNMLRRMYETVQEPFLNATTMGGDSANDAGSNPFAALLGTQGLGQNRAPTTPSTANSDTTGSPAPNTNPLPNPWNPSANAQGTAAGAQTNTGTRTAPMGGTRQPSVGGVPGLGLPDLGGLGGGSGLFDPAMMQQMLQNPAIIQMMQGLLSNPQYMNQFRSLLDNNTQLRDMMQSPEFLRQLTSPESLQQLLSLQQAVVSQLARQQPGGQEQAGAGAGAGAGTGGANMGLEALLGMFGGLGGGNIQNTPNVPPEQLYATQLAQLQEMGFYDTQENIRALSATGGNVHAAVERLLGNLG